MSRCDRITYVSPMVLKKQPPNIRDIQKPLFVCMVAVKGYGEIDSLASREVLIYEMKSASCEFFKVTM